MTNETTAATTSTAGAAAAPESQFKAREVLAEQQQNEASDDEEFLSDTAEVVDANDATQYTQTLNLDLKEQDEKVWLVRVPKFLAEVWKDREKLQGQKLGTIKIKKNTPKPAMRVVLEDSPEVKDLPHNFDLQLTRSTVENQYVFLERKYVKPEAKEEEELKEEKPLSLEEKEFQKRLRFLTKRKRRFNKYQNKDGTEKVIPFVKTIPKETAMKGTVVHEAQLIPSIRDPNYSKVIAQRKQYFKEEPRPSVTLLQEHSGVSLSNAGLTLRSDTSSFLKAAEPKKKGEYNRSIRMPQKELLDLLFKLFDQYDYWSLKGLKERTKQPEVYLKENLDKIAQLIKKGPYALKYALKKEYKELKDQERSAKLGELGNEEEEEEEEEPEEDIEMEDVV